MCSGRKALTPCQKQLHLVSICDDILVMLGRQLLLTRIQVQINRASTRLGKVCPQCNTVVHAKEFNRSMRLRKVCPQCNTTVHVKRSVCDCGHAFTLKKRKAPYTAVGEPVNTMKCRNALLSEETLLVMKQRDEVSEPTQSNLRDFVCQQTVKERGLPSFLHR